VNFNDGISTTFSKSNDATTASTTRGTIPEIWFFLTSNKCTTTDANANANFAHGWRNSTCFAASSTVYEKSNLFYIILSLIHRHCRSPIRHHLFSPRQSHYAQSSLVVSLTNVMTA
jgi:hypothetical protein